MGEGKNRVVNPIALAEIIRRWSPTEAIVERVHAMPAQGVSSTFKFGHTAGRIDATVLLCGVPMRLVTPRQWKRYFRLGPDKEDARRLAIERHPRIADRLDRKKDEGRAEALLIATYHLEKRNRHHESVKRDTRETELSSPDR